MHDKEEEKKMEGEGGKRIKMEGRKKGGSHASRS